MPSTGLSRAGPGGPELLGLEQRQIPHLHPLEGKKGSVHPQPASCRGGGTDVCFGNNNSSALLQHSEEGCKQVNKNGAAFVLNSAYSHMEIRLIEMIGSLSIPLSFPILHLFPSLFECSPGSPAGWLQVAHIQEQRTTAIQHL